MKRLLRAACLLIILWSGEALSSEADTAVNLVFCCAADNDLYHLVSDGDSEYPRYESAAQAIEAAAQGAGVLILASGYPDTGTTITPADLARAAAKQLRLYVEFPSALPELTVSQPLQARLERGVVTSAFFGADLPSMRIVQVNDCRYVPVQIPSSHLVLARVAGVDTAVFGLEGTPTAPLLFEHPRGNLLVATTRLSQFVRGRFMPGEAWQIIWRRILAWLQPGRAVPPLDWVPAVRPTYGRDEPMPPDAEKQAVLRALDWVGRSRVLRHAGWPQEALGWADHYNTVRDRPAADWPLGDGSLGITEGFSSSIRADGSQPMRYAVRNDCMAETAMLLALGRSVGGNSKDETLATNLIDYILGSSGLAGGPRADPANASYGLIGWALDHPGAYWGDDNARALLGMLTASAVLQESRWSDALARNLLANLRTSGPNGHRPRCLMQPDLEARGWQAYWSLRKPENTAHMTAWLWPCFLWAYAKTGFEPFLTRSEAGARTLMTAYPDWDYVLGSASLERARALLPLAWLVRVQDTPEHRRWLRRIAEDLIALQDASGGIREVLATGQGAYRDSLCQSNADYGTGETSLIQTDSDRVADMLYTCNFALIGLHEAAAATGEALYSEAEEKLAQFLCRIQIRSAAHPELDGAWYRAFNLGNWDYWASNADWEWGPWCVETGWTQPWIAGTLALRQMKASLWELLASAPVSPAFDRLSRQMLPEDVLLRAQGK